MQEYLGLLTGLIAIVPAVIAKQKSKKAKKEHDDKSEIEDKLKMQQMAILKYQLQIEDALRDGKLTREELTKLLENGRDICIDLRS